MSDDKGDHYSVQETVRRREAVLKRISVEPGASLIQARRRWWGDEPGVIADGLVAARIMKAAASLEGSPWLWTLDFGHHEDRTPTHGYAATREAAMATFAEG